MTWPMCIKKPFNLRKNLQHRVRDVLMLKKYLIVPLAQCRQIDAEAPDCRVSSQRLKLSTHILPT